MWWHDLLWDFWNGFSAWIVLIAHLFGVWDHQAVYDANRGESWYGLGFVMGVTMIGGVIRDLTDMNASSDEE